MTQTKTNLGILAYGSLIKDPGIELEGKIISEIEIKTPFEVEYARSSNGRDNAPTLVPVEDGQGAKVKSKILILSNDITEQQAKDMLYRREKNKVESSETYDDKKQRSMNDSVIIEILNDYEEVSVVLYASLKANIDKILDNNISDEDKAKCLAKLAISSVTKKTFYSMRDGIQYLADAIDSGIQTPLTELYKQEILIQTNNSPNLEKARLSIDKKNGIIT